MRPVECSPAETTQSASAARRLTGWLSRILFGRSDNDDPSSEEVGESRFAFWSVVGFSTGLLGIFCLLLSAFLVGNPLFEKSRTIIALALGSLGLFVFLWDRRRSSHAPSVTPTSQDEPASPSGDRSLRLSVFSWSYLGLLLVCMSVVVFLFERQQEEKPVVVVEAPRQAKKPESPAPKADPEPRPEPLRPAPQIKIQGLLYDPQNPTIIVNGQAYGEGDTLDGVEILDIQRASVVVRYASSTNTYVLEW